MMLSDCTIKKFLKTGDIIIKPFTKSQLQAASYDVCLNNEFLVLDNTKGTVIDPKSDVSLITRKITASAEKPFVLHPNEFALCSTQEIIGVNEKYVCILNGKSSLGRIGLLVHATAGFIDPGNELRITLELFNVATLPIILYPGMKIAQVSFMQLTEPCERPYGHPELKSKYYKDTGVKSSQIYKNFKE